MNVVQYAERLKSSGAYIGDDGHVYRVNGVPYSRRMRNGYYTIRAMFDGVPYCYMEHRVVWAWYHPDMNEDLVINHIDFNRGNNRIENLELVTQSENVAHSVAHNRLNPAFGERSGKTTITNRQAKMIRYLRNHGYSISGPAKMLRIQNSNQVSRITNRRRFDKIPDARNVLEIYPEFVRAMTFKHRENPRDALLEAVLGLAGEVGEICDMYKKHCYQGHDLSVDELILELGDVLFYLVMLCNELDIDFSEIAEQNIAKLRERYPDGFDPERSIHRPEYEVVDK